MLSRSGDGMAFQILGTRLRIVLSTGLGWDHVSVSTRARCPTWDEMCRVKKICFQPEECAVQYHPAEADYIDCHPFCLHLWRPQQVEIPMPPKVCV